MHLLIVEDDAAFLPLLRRDLETIPGAELTVVGSMEAVEALDSDVEFDVALLDLALPDAWGLDTLLSFRRLRPALPVVVVSGTQQDDFRDKAYRAGAVGYVSKSTLAPGDAAMAVREVHAAAGERAESSKAQTVAELAWLAELDMETRSPATARAFGQAGLAQQAPRQFEALVGQYADLLELVMEQRLFGADYHGAMHTRDFAFALGAINAGPKDVVSLHAAALEVLSRDRQRASSRNFAEEARFVVLELMGYLVAYYRVQALGERTS